MKTLEVGWRVGEVSLIDLCPDEIKFTGDPHFALWQEEGGLRVQGAQSLRDT